MVNYEASQSGAVTTLSTNEGFKVMVTSDVHFDSVLCNRGQFFADLGRAAEMGAPVIIVGDFFDAMNGRFDPRRDMSRLRPEYRREDYYDYIVKDAAEKLGPFAGSLLMVTPGNHELSVLKNANTDLVGRLVELLSSGSHSVLTGGYGGVIMMRYGGTSVPVKYFHGSGGEAPVTRGAIQTNRQAVFLPDFQVVLNGHSHHSYWIPVTRERVTSEGEHYFDIQHHVRTPGYVLAYGDGSGGWDVTRGGVPKPIGSFFLEFGGGEVLPVPLIHPPVPVSTIADMYDGIVFPQE